MTGRLSCVALLLCATTAFANPKAGMRTLEIQAVSNELQFRPRVLRMRAGEHVRLVFRNRWSQDSGMQHNWILARPGRKDQVAEQGLQAGIERGYIPKSRDVLAASHLTDPGRSVTIEFTAPAQPGRYPFLCSVPGHSSTMTGFLEVSARMTGYFR